MAKDRSFHIQRTYVLSSLVNGESHIAKYVRFKLSSARRDKNMFLQTILRDGSIFLRDSSAMSIADQRTLIGHIEDRLISFINKPLADSSTFAVAPSLSAQPTTTNVCRPSLQQLKQISGAADPTTSTTTIEPLEAKPNRDAFYMCLLSKTNLPTNMVGLRHTTFIRFLQKQMALWDGVGKANQRQLIKKYQTLDWKTRNQRIDELMNLLAEKNDTRFDSFIQILRVQPFAPLPLHFVNNVIMEESSPIKTFYEWKRSPKKWKIKKKKMASEYTRRVQLLVNNALNAMSYGNIFFRCKVDESDKHLRLLMYL